MYRFVGSEGSAAIQVDGTLQVNNGHALRAVALQGLGIIPQPEILVAALVEVPEADMRLSAVQGPVWWIADLRWHGVVLDSDRVGFASEGDRHPLSQATQMPGTAILRNRCGLTVALSG